MVKVGNDAPAPFDGFGPDAPAFFRELEAEQNRDWFLANKARYEREVALPLGRLVRDVSFALAARDVPLTGDPKTSVFRIHRDVRFAKDKRPYKSNAGAVLTRDGVKGSQGILYLHVDPLGSFAAAGFYQPEPPALEALRRRIVEAPERWRGVVEGLEAAGLAVSEGDAAARLPRGFDAAEVGDLARWVRLKSFTVSRPLSAAELAGPGLVETLVGFAETARPLLDFGWGALERGRPAR